MALLIVSTVSEDTIAAPGNRLPNYLLVSVTDSAGIPVTGLEVGNFKVHPMVVGPGGAAVDIELVWGSQLPGFYRIQVVPTRNYTWTAGVYVFAVAVQRAVDQGQALTTVLLD